MLPVEPFVSLINILKQPKLQPKDILPKFTYSFKFHLSKLCKQILKITSSKATMFFSKSSMLAIVALTGVSLAAPTISRRDTMSCYCSDRGFAIGHYSVYISATYNGGAGCNAVFAAINQSGAIPSSWHCDAADDGNTQLTFNALTGQANGINAALGSMYPNVDGGFNCPDY